MDRALRIIIFLAIICIVQVRGVLANYSQTYLNYLSSDLLITPRQTLDELEIASLKTLYSPEAKTSSLDEREKHLQLTISLYRREQFSLMLKSMKIFNEKYGADKEAALHYFLQIAVLEKKIKEHSNISDQLINMAKKGIASESGDLNLKLAFYKLILKQNLINKDWINFDKDLEATKDFVSKFTIQNEMIWVAKMKMESLLAQGAFDRAKDELKHLGVIPSVYRDDYSIYLELTQKNYEKVKIGYLNSDWTNYTVSLLNNMSFVSILLGDQDRARVYLSKYAQYFGSRDERYLILNGIFHRDAEALVFLNPKYNLISKFIQLEDSKTTMFTSDEQGIMNQELRVLLWKVRLENLVVDRQEQIFMDYLSDIPFYELSSEESLFILSPEIQSYLNIQYENISINQSSDDVIKHWEKVTIKTQPTYLFNKDIFYTVGKAYVDSRNSEKYLSFLKTVPLDVIEDLQCYNYYKKEDYQSIISKIKNSHNLEVKMMKAIAYERDRNYKFAKKIINEVLLSKKISQTDLYDDFTLAYIRVLKSENNPEEFYQRLVGIKDSINDHGAKKNRVKEYVEAELIGINVALKHSSLEKNLKNVNIFLKNYPQSQFYSMMELTRGKILAQLKKIAESTEVLQKVLKETDDEKIKTQASDELIVLKKI